MILRSKNYTPIPPPPLGPSSIVNKPASKNIVEKKFKQVEVKQHAAIVVNSCSSPDCVDRNCSKDAANCTVTKSWEEGAIIATKTHVVASLTHNVPKNLKEYGTCLDPKKDYAGKSRMQYIVSELDPVEVHPSEVAVKEVVSTYVQDETRTEILMTARPNGADELRERLRIKWDTHKSMEDIS